MVNVMCNFTTIKKTINLSIFEGLLEKRVYTRLRIVRMRG